MKYFGNTKLVNENNLLGGCGKGGEFGVPWGFSCGEVLVGYFIVKDVSDFE